MKRSDFLLVLLLIAVMESAVYFGLLDPREALHYAVLFMVFLAAHGWGASVLARDYAAIAKRANKGNE